MSEEASQAPPPRKQLAPSDPRYVYTTVIERIGGTIVDMIFLHIILIPLRVPAADWSFRTGTIVPAIAFTLVYFGVLILLLRYRGLTPGGLPLRYRVRDLDMQFLSWMRCWRRIAPHIIIHAIGLWRLHAVIQGFQASGEPYDFKEIPALMKEYGGLWNVAVAALNGFIIVDLLFVIQSPRNQSLSDRLAGSFVVSRAAHSHGTSDPHR